MKNEITKLEKWQIIGLLTIAAQHNKALEEIEKTLKKVTGEENSCGHCTDAIYCDLSADELIVKLKLKVKDE